MHAYKAIPQRLPVNGLPSGAEKDMKTEKQKMKRAGGVSDGGILMFRSFGLFHWKDV